MPLYWEVFLLLRFIMNLKISRHVIWQNGKIASLFFICSSIIVILEWLIYWLIMLSMGSPVFFVFSKRFLFNVIFKLLTTFTKNLLSIFTKCFFRFILGSETNSNSLKPSKNHREMLFIYVKISFCSWGIYIFILTFWLCRNTAW